MPLDLIVIDQMDGQRELMVKEQIAGRANNRLYSHGENNLFLFDFEKQLEWVMKSDMRVRKCGEEIFKSP